MNCAREIMSRLNRLSRRLPRSSATNFTSQRKNRWRCLMSGTKKYTRPLLLACLLLFGTAAFAQEMPGDYQEVLKSLDRKGDFKDGVLKVNIPRSDLKITVAGVATPTPFGFGGWVAFTKTNDGGEVMMGDLVLLQEEVNPVMSALLDNGIEVTALHNHFFWDDP